MRFTRFMRRILDNGLTEVVNFGAEHFTEAGLRPALLGGMPQLEAYQLINKWNGGQATPRFVYWLE